MGLSHFFQSILENYLRKQDLRGYSALSWKQCGKKKPVAVARGNIFKKTSVLLSFF